MGVRRRKKPPTSSVEVADVVDAELERRWEEGTLLDRVKIRADMSARVAELERDRAVESGWDEIRRTFVAATGDETAHPAGLGAIATHGKALHWLEPFERDHHLTVLDSWLLPELARVRLDLPGLEQRVARMPYGIAGMLSPEVGVVSPIVWRWLRDAERRRLVEPLDEDPAASTCWDLTELGAAEASRLQSSAVLSLLKDWNKSGGGVQSVIGTGKAFVGAVVLLGGASLVTARELPAWVTDLAVFGLVVVAAAVAGMAIEDLWSWWQRSRRGPRGDTYQPQAKHRAFFVRHAVWREAGWQHTVAAIERRDTPGFEPPRGWSEPPSVTTYDGDGRAMVELAAPEPADR